MAATTGIAGNGSTYISPTKDNDYLVSFDDWGNAVSTATVYNYGPMWTNPLIGKVFQPYLPCMSQLAQNFQKSISFENRPVLCLDFFVPTFIPFELEDLQSLSLVNKCCYVAMRSDAIWSGKVQDLLPNVKCISSPACTFSPEQQFQIVFKKIQNRKAPFQLQRDYWQGRFEQDVSFVDGLATEPPDVKERLRRKYFGISSSEDEKSIDSSSKVGACLYALEMIPEEFNDQSVFQELILAAQAATHNTASVIMNIGDVEEVDEGDIMGPEDDDHLNIITEMFNPESIPTENQIKEVLCRFGKIEYAEFKMKAFAYILMNPSLESPAAREFCSLLPESLKKQWLNKILELNHNSTVYEGKDYGDDFFGVIIHYAANSKIAKEAAFEVFVALENKNR